MVRSRDEGRTWSKPVTIYDDALDNRDSHIAQMSDGTVVCTFFSLRFEEKIEQASGQSLVHYGSPPRRYVGAGMHMIRSFDNGNTWEKEATVVATTKADYYCSAQVREMPDKSWLLPIYHQARSKDQAWGGVVISRDKGKTWAEEIPIGKESGRYLPAETDVILLKDGSLYAALRGSIPHQVNMHYATSKDLGKTWSAVSDIGFQGHAPSFTRLKSGAILMSYRAFTDNNDSKKGYTGLRISYDDARTWQGPYLVDKTWGAYPATVELKDGSVLIIYYEEGKDSGIRALRFTVPPKSTQPISLDRPESLKTLSLK
ncbi:hypothetical protein GCM10023189_43980 [Nibrella saemangeumensis]|uniref:Sialidase domain-containing protein n=2 Tax=Nibrella saemangeumensis TaxID=1084526 RepID=A0ABP8NBN5_9BACT